MHTSRTSKFRRYKGHIQDGMRRLQDGIVFEILSYVQCYSYLRYMPSSQPTIGRQERVSISSPPASHAL
jgi:hypothetical protein